MTTISLERIAGKIHWLRNCGDPKAEALLADPRFVEILCFLSWISHLPGGIEKFVADFIASAVEWFGTLPKIPRTWIKENPDHVSDLAWYLVRWCEEEHPETVGSIGFAEFERRFPGIVKPLLAYMERHAKAELAKTADTSLRRKVFSELEFARKSNPPIPMVFFADTRHGKTTACATYCRAWPGRARLVTIPESLAERDFYGAYAEAFGMDFTPRIATNVLKDRVQFVLRNVGLFIVHDEFHYAIPTRFSKDTPPHRLNWIRAQIIDRHLPCAFFATPQSHRETLARYVSKTHYNLEQWLGRMPAPVLVSTEPTYDDLMSVARARFGEFSEDALAELCDAADQKIESAGSRLNGESGFKIVELAGARARFIAGQRGAGQVVTLADVREAASWAGAPMPQPEQRNTFAECPPTHSGKSAEPLPKIRVKGRRRPLRPVTAI